jgi:Rieske Fe-S protein
VDRKTFIKTCGYSCLGATSISILLQGCVSTKTINSPIENDNVIVPLSAFEKEKNGEKQILDYVIVQNRQLSFPIYVFRFSNTEYTALYLKCTHQGTELNAYGEKLVCSSHGSEFDNKGNVTKGPATMPLRSLSTKINAQNISISLKQ